VEAGLSLYIVAVIGRSDVVDVKLYTYYLMLMCPVIQWIQMLVYYMTLTLSFVRSHTYAGLTAILPGEWLVGSP